jgi:aspartyl-tRNA synthetase
MERTLVKNTVDKVDEEVVLQGWVASVRDHGKITFLDLRDRTGVVQCVGQDLPKVTVESVVEIKGKVAKRPEKLVNKGVETGGVEMQIEELAVLSPAKELPMPLDTDGYEIGEETRLRYRYLDLRRARLQRNIKQRSEYVRYAREYLFGEDFTEIETPMLTKSTPEGSRDFVVPSRVYPGKFFALPQSPQQYKQLLMTAGFERYFQIARCIRDEDPRADRGYEHTQIDLEMSFVSQEQVMKTVEKMTIYALEKIGAKISKKPFPVITYKEAMEKYGADKFDLRTDREKNEGIMSFSWVVDFPFFEKNKEGGWTFTHNPFSAPKNEEHEKWLLEKQNIEKITTAQYDLICNGFEVGGGSIRTHKSEVLRTTFQIMGYSDPEIDEKFGHMLEAFEFGTPPHGGCAQGFERLLMARFGEEYLREMQAFPQTGRGRTSVMDAPSKLSSEQLKELGLKVVENKK